MGRGESYATSHLALEHLYLGIGIIDDSVELCVEMPVFLGQVLNHVVMEVATEALVKLSMKNAGADIHLLRSLVRPKGQSTSSTFHDCGWIKSAQDTRLIVFTRLQNRRDCIVWVAQG